MNTGPVSYTHLAKPVRKWLNGSGENFEWLEDLGLEYSFCCTESADLSKIKPTHNRTGHWDGQKWVMEMQGPKLVKCLREACARYGVEIMTGTRARHLLTEDGRVTGVRLSPRKGEPWVAKSAHVIAAPGRGGAEWLTNQAEKLGLRTQNNEVDIGVRVEVPNAIMDHLTKYLYEAKLIYYSDTYENKVRTFCMNPGGVVSEEHYESGLAVVNGHSYGDPARRTGNTNFALLVSTRFTEPFNQPIEYGQYIARLGNMLTGGPIMVQRLGDLLQGRRTSWERLAKSTTIPTLQTAVPGDLSFVLPPRHLTSIVEALKAFDHLAPGLYSKNTLLYGVEVKFYSSKVLVDRRFMTPIEGLYAIGDGAGITRGLMQALSLIHI